MTQLADPEIARTSAAPGRVSHWIGGRTRRRARPAAQGDVYDPATGRLARHVDFASADEVAAAVAAAKAAFPAWRATSLSKRTDIMFKIRNLVDQRRHELAAHLTAEHGKVPSDALGEIARGLENLEFACGIPNLLKGGFTEQALDRRRRLPDPPAARRRRRHHAVQLPGDGPDVDVRDRDRDAATRSSSSRPRRTRRRRSSWPSCSHEAGVPDGVFNVVHGDKVAVDAILDAPGHRRGQLRRLDADRALHLRDRDRERQARPGARRRQEPHDRAARRGHRHGRRRGGLGGLRLGRRAVHGDRHGRRGRRRGRSAGRGDHGAPAQGQGRARAATPRPRWGRSSRASIATRSRRTSTARAGPGRDRRRRRPRAPALRRVATGSSWASR